MTDLRKAAQKALKALEFDRFTPEDLTHRYYTKKAITALKAALEQQAEPVAYFDFQEFKFTWAKHMKIGPVPVSIKVEPLKLYSEAAQRQWVGLEAEDLAQIESDEFWQTGNHMAIAMAVEAKLKERNT